MSSNTEGPTTWDIEDTMNRPSDVKPDRNGVTVIELASLTGAVDMIRDTVVAQAAHIEAHEAAAAEQQAEIAKLKASIRRHTDVLEYANGELKLLRQKNKELTIELEDKTAVNKTMHDRLTAHAEARYQGKTPNHMEQFGPMLNRATEIPIDSNTTHIDQYLNNKAWDEENPAERTHRIAAAIKRRINDNHLSIALMLCDALMEDTKDGHGNTRDPKSKRATRSEDNTRTCKSLGVPYIGD